MRTSSVIASLAAASSAAGMAIRSSSSTPIWMTLPPTPALPSPISTEKYPINGIKMWAQKYNVQAGVVPIVMDHGGLGYSAYFGSVISRLIAAGHYVIALDRRGHGRSTYNLDDVFTFQQMAIDVYDLLKTLDVPEYYMVGWSDGGITTLQALMNATMAAPIKKAYLYGASTLPSQTNSTFSDTAIFSEFVSRCDSEYAVLQPTANFTNFALKVATMEDTLPQYTEAELGTIDGSIVMVADGEYEEAISFGVPQYIHNAIPGSSLQILTNVSHFAPLQDPEQFTKSVLDFLY